MRFPPSRIDYNFFSSSTAEYSSFLILLISILLCILLFVKKKFKGAAQELFTLLFVQSHRMIPGKKIDTMSCDTYNIHYRRCYMAKQALFDYQEFFKSIYYYLYSNGNSSRTERIVSAITKVLLCKLLLEKKKEYSIEKIEIKELLNLLKESYPSIFQQFDDFAMTEEELKTVLEMLSNISLSVAPSHIIGDAFQTIIGPTIRDDKGQFFTPKSLVQYMVKVIDPKNGEIIMDPACGTGGFLTESFIFQYEGKKKKCKSRYIGMDKDKDMWDLSMAVTEIITNGHANVYK